MDTLKKQETLPLVQFDDAANTAVRENNKAIVAKAETLDVLQAKPAGGNIAKFQEANSDQAIKCCEAS